MRVITAAALVQLTQLSFKADHFLRQLSALRGGIIMLQRKNNYFCQCYCTDQGEEEQTLALILQIQTSTQESVQVC